jgi:hypothetical protein
MLFYGGVVKYHHDFNGEYEKDTIVSKLLPDTITSCALHTGKSSNEPCISSATVNKISDILNIDGDATSIITQAVDKLECDSTNGNFGEFCVIKKLKNKIGESIVEKELNNEKISGPTDNKLLSNIHIDAIMRQWAKVFHDFFPYNFNMRNYADYSYVNGRVVNSPDTLATIPVVDLIDGSFNGKKYKMVGCIINTDVYQGGGIHWMALFVDARSSEPSVEFFNSSGNSPSPEWVNWMVKTKSALDNHLNVKSEIFRVSNIRHQKSKSECGLYSLFYIWSRINKIPIEYFATTPIPDSNMFEFRQHLFNDPKRAVLKSFKWNEYKKEVDIKWE